MPEPVSNLKFKPKLAMKTTWATNEYPHLGFVPLSPRMSGCFCAYMTLILPQANIPLVAYNGAIVMEVIFSCFKIGMS